jgi:hypothetical protein
LEAKMFQTFSLTFRKTESEEQENWYRIPAFFQFFPILIQSHVNKTEIISQIIETYLPEEFHERQQLYEQEHIQG